MTQADETTAATTEPATTWGLGDYPEMAERLVPIAEEVVARAQIDSGQRVLDVACGTGNAAVLAAALGAAVAGIDSEPTLLELARRRASEVEWRCADAAVLPWPDNAFDRVLSIFGAMYVPDQGAIARELVRVCAPGGRLVLAAWTPGSFMPAFGGVLAPYLPPLPPLPPGGQSPARWGDEDAVAGLLESAGATVTAATRATRALRLPDREEAVDFLLRTAGHVAAIRDEMEADGRWEALREDVAQFVEARRLAGPADVLLPVEYLVVTVES
jgi:SAM-dependent methyltransferase